MIALATYGPSPKRFGDEDAHHDWSIQYRKWGSEYVPFAKSWYASLVYERTLDLLLAALDPVAAEKYLESRNRWRGYIGQADILPPIDIPYIPHEKEFAPDYNIPFAGER